MSLIHRYNAPVPRYTSYPTVPLWDNNLNEQTWKEHIARSFSSTNDDSGISLYIHLPYCESLCTYCACNTRITVNHAVEEPYIEALLREWQMYLSVMNKKPRIKELHLGGGTPTFFSHKNLEKLILGIFDTAEKCNDADFSFEAHPANTTEEHLKVLSNLGFKRISFGIQDFDIKVQKAINRYQSIEEVKSIVDLALSNGFVSINFDFVYGLPFQTIDSIETTFNEALKIKPQRIAFYSYAHVPWIKPGQRKFTEKDLPSSELKRGLYNTGKKLLLDEGYHEIGMDHFSLKDDELYGALKQKKLHRNFMGYTPSHTQLLIGLGVSAISDTWTSFSQNLKSVEDYLEQIQKDKFPLFKGHLLTNEDLFIRKHLLNLMCFYETTFEGLSNEERELVKSILERLSEPENDGLLKITENKIEITARGMPFVRNVCFCLDQRYWNKELATKNLFSMSI